MSREAALIMVVLHAGLTLFLAPEMVRAQTSSSAAYPVRPIRLIVGYPPGGATDIVARLVGKHLGGTWSQQVVVDNRPGASGMIGSSMAARAPADGYTLLGAASPEIVITPSLYPDMPYDPTKDFAPVSLVAIAPYLLLTNASLPGNSVKEFIAYARTQPGKLSFASGGTGTAIHLTGELFSSVTGIKMVHVPYKGSAPAISDLVAGQIQVMFETIAVGMPHVNSGRLKVLGIATPKRSPALSHIPTIDESGLPGFTGYTWYGLLAPTATPRSIIQKLAGEIGSFLGTPTSQEWFGKQGIDPVGSSPSEFSSFIKTERDKWDKVVRDARIQIKS